MAESIISPGVFQRENDISFIQPAPAEAGAAIIGPTVKGPVEQPTVVSSYNEYTRLFGETFEVSGTSQEYLTSLAVKNYFQQGGESVLVTRVVATASNFSSAQSTAIASGIPAGAAAIAASGSFAYVSGSDDQQFIISDGTVSETFILQDLSQGQPLSEDLDSVNHYFVSSSADSAEQLAELIVRIDAESTLVDASDDGGQLKLEAKVAGESGNSITYAMYGATAVNLAGGTAEETQSAFVLETLGQGAIFNSDGVVNNDGSLAQGSADNLRFEITNINSTAGTFALSIRRGDDTDKQKVILETFNNLSLDPNSENYIEKRIGTQRTQVSVDSYGTYVELLGEYVNISKYVRVAAVANKTINYIGNDGVTVGTGSEGSYTLYLPTPQSGQFAGATGANGAGNFFGDITTDNMQGLAVEDYTNAINILGNSEEYFFNVITAPGLIKDSGVDALISLAETRGDCIAVVDLGTKSANIGAVTTQAATLNSSYAAAYYPWVKMRSSNGRDVWTPASTAIPGVYAFTDNSSAPWFAPAGLIRGGLTGVIDTERTLRRTHRDELYSGKVNPIAKFPGQGIAIFGQKTLQTKASALDRINVRKLLIELKDFIGKESRKLVFEQNTIATRNRFLANVTPYLESVVQRNGLYSFEVKMDDENNTADVVDRNQLIGQIRIRPAKTSEFIILDYVIEPTGASFDA